LKTLRLGPGESAIAGVCQFVTAIWTGMARGSAERQRRRSASDAVGARGARARGAAGLLLFALLLLAQPLRPLGRHSRPLPRAEALPGPAATRWSCQRHDRTAGAARALAGRAGKMRWLLVPALRGGSSGTSRVDCAGCGQAVRPHPTRPGGALVPWHIPALSSARRADACVLCAGRRSECASAA